MEYTFSWGAFVFGIVLLGMSGALVLWHKQIADGMGFGMASYDRYRLVGLIGCAVGFGIMLNLHSLILSLVLGTLFGR